MIAPGKTSGTKGPLVIRKILAQSSTVLYNKLKAFTMVHAVNSECLELWNRSWTRMLVPKPREWRYPRATR